MTTSSATFEFSTDGGASWKASDLPLTGANALALSGSPIVVKARLSSLAGVHTVVWTVTTADDATIEAGPLPVPVQASDKSATLTIPGTGGRSYVLEAAVNGIATLRRRLAIHVKTSNSLEVLAAGEYDEANRTYGWTGALNAAIRAIAAGGGGGVTSLATLAGALTLSNGGGVINAPSGSDIGLRIGFGSDVQGDIPVAGVGGTYARKALGATNTVLTSNGTTANWAVAVNTLAGTSGTVTLTNGGGVLNTPSGGTNIALAIGFGSDARGDLPIRGISGYGRVALGATGTQLTSNGTDASWAAPVTVGGAAPSGGAVTFTAGGTTGILATPSGNDVAFRLSVASQATGDLIVATGATTWGPVHIGANGTVLTSNGTTASWAAGGLAPTPSGAGDKDKAVVVDGSTGTTLVLSATPWLTALHVGAGGSVAASTFGTGAIQAQSDTANGQGVGVRCDASLDIGSVAFFDDANALKGNLELNSATSLLTLRGGAIGVRITTSANDSTVPVFCEASTNNVGLCNTTSFGGMVGGVAIANGTTAPTTVSGTYAALYNGAGTLQICAGSTVDVKPGGTTTRFRVTTAVTSVASTNFSVGVLSPSVGGMSGGIFLGNVTTAPATNPSSGIDIYSNAAVFTVKDSSGNLTYSVSAHGSATASGLFLATASLGTTSRELKKRSLTINGVTINYLTDEA